MWNFCTHLIVLADKRSISYFIYVLTIFIGLSLSDFVIVLALSIFNSIHVW